MSSPESEISGESRRPEREAAGMKTPTAVEALYLSDTGARGLFTGTPTNLGKSAGRTCDNIGSRTPVRNGATLSSPVGCAI